MKIIYFIGLFLFAISLNAGKSSEAKKKRRAEKKAQEIKELQPWGIYFEEHPEEKDTCVIGAYFQAPTLARREPTSVPTTKLKGLGIDKRSDKANSVYWRTKYPHLPIKKAILKHLQDQEQALNDEISE